MAEATPLFMDIDGVYSGDELSIPYRDLVTEGVCCTQASCTDLRVTQRGAGANLSVDVAQGAAWVQGDFDNNLQGSYRIYNNGTVNLGISPDPTNPRKVLVVAQVTDEGFTGTGRNWALVAIHGTPAGSPVEPSLPASALPLALIDVTAADASIADSQITDRRVPARIGSDRLGQYRSYTPVWASSGVAPAIGNGTLSGAYIQIGKLVIGRIYWLAGSTTTFGTGNYSFTLPVTLGGTAPVFYQSLGTVEAVDSGGAWYGGFALSETSTTVSIFNTGQPQSIWGQTVPFTWGNTDYMHIRFTYEAA